MARFAVGIEITSTERDEHQVDVLLHNVLFGAVMLLMNQTDCTWTVRAARPGRPGFVFDQDSADFPSDFREITTDEGN